MPTLLACNTRIKLCRALCLRSVTFRKRCEMVSFVNPPSFATSFPCTRGRSRCVQRKATIRCVATKKVVQPDSELSSQYYRVIQPNEDPSSLPPPPEVHRSIPLFGYVIEHMLGLSTCRTRAKRYGPIYRSNFFVDDFVYIADMYTSKDILKDTTNFSSEVNNKLASFFGENSLIIIDGERHAVLRKVLAPAFSPSMFSNYFDGILSATESMWAQVSSDISISSGNKKKVLLDPVFRQHYMGIIIQVSSGIDATSDLTSRLGKIFTEAVAGLVGPTWGPLWERSQHHRAEIAATLRKVIANKLVNETDIIESLRSVTDNNNESSISMLAVKNQLKKGMDITQVAVAQTDLPTGKKPTDDCSTVSSLVDLLFLVWGAGFFTSAATTSCAVFEAGMNPEILRALVEEQDMVMKQSASEKVTYDQIMEDMPLLDSYVMEILRLFPAGTGILRTVKNDVVILNKTIKAGSMLFIDLIASLADENLYEDAETVKVDRFLKDKDADVPKPIVFGGPKSPHYCVGAPLAKLLIKTNLAVMLRNYNLVLEPTQSRKYRVIPDYTPSSQVALKSLDKRM